MITVCMIISSVGHTVPPVFIFPRARPHDLLMFGAPPGSLGLVYSAQSSWITEPLFLEVPEHVMKHTRSSKEDRIILPMDSHTVTALLIPISIATESSITLVTFPLHCSHQLQPLDVGVMGAFKGKLWVAHDGMTANTGKVITVHDLTSLTNAAYHASVTVKNITAVFAKSGIWPFSRLAFSDGDF